MAGLTWSSLSSAAALELEWRAGRTPPVSGERPPPAGAGRSRPTAEPVATRSCLHQHDDDGAGVGVGAAGSAAPTGWPASTGPRRPRAPRER